jgi:hypothetical protein
VAKGKMRQIPKVILKPLLFRLQRDKAEYGSVFLQDEQNNVKKAIKICTKAKKPHVLKCNGKILFARSIFNRTISPKASKNLECG